MRSLKGRPQRPPSRLSANARARVQPRWQAQRAVGAAGTVVVAVAVAAAVAAVALPAASVAAGAAERRPQPRAVTSQPRQRALTVRRLPLLHPTSPLMPGRPRPSDPPPQPPNPGQEK